MPLIADTGSNTISRVQLFVASKYLSNKDLPDAKDTVDSAFDGLAEDLTWTGGIKRIFYFPPDGVEDHIRDIKNTIYTIFDMTGEVMMTNHLPRREMYLYYTASKAHDIEYADAEYMCFEVPIDADAEVSTLIGTLSILSRKDDPSKPIISAAEATKAFHRGTIKLKLMPRDVVEDNWEEISDVLGADLINFFERHHKS